MATLRLGFGLTVLVALAGCADDSDTQPGIDAEAPDALGDVAPTLIPGGGVADSPMAGELNVFVIDEATGLPLVGAAVQVGDAASASPLTGATDATGLVTFSSAALAGAQTVTARADGHVVVTWVGVLGANVTIPLTPIEAPAIETATVKGTIAGWESFPEPLAGHTTAVFIASSSMFLGHPVEQTTQQIGEWEAPANLCIKGATIDRCDFTLITEPGRQFLAGLILDMDTNGTPANGDDDTTTLVGYAFAMDLELAADQVLEAVALAQVPSDDLATATVNISSPPAGLAQVVGFPAIDMGTQGIMPLGLAAFDPVANSVLLPKLAGDLAGGEYMFIASAQASAEIDQPSSLGLVRGVTDLATAIELPPWLAPPANATFSDDTVAFDATGALVNSIEVASGQGTRVWSVVLLDGSNQFTFPALSPDPLPTGAFKVQVAAMDLPDADRAAFTLDGVFESLARQSSNQIDATR